MDDGVEEFDVDSEVVITEMPDIDEGECAEIEVSVCNAHCSVALNEVLEQVRRHPYRPGDSLHEKIRYELNCLGYEVVAYRHLSICYPVSDELELGDVKFKVVVTDVGILPGVA